MRTAMRVEALKLRRSPVGAIATLALLVGTLGLLAGITAGVAAEHPQMIAQAGPAAALDWTGLLAGAAQIIAAGGFIGFGVVLAWMFGREFTEGTVTGLFGLPVSRGRIALAKLAVHGIWVAGVALLLVLGLLGLGLALGYGAPSPQAWSGLARMGVLAVLTGVLTVPVAWVATLSRSLLAGVAAVIGLVALAQVGALAGAGAWMPWAAPALWAMAGPSEVTAMQILLAVLLTLTLVVLTCRSWSRLQLDR